MADAREILTRLEQWQALSPADAQTVRDGLPAGADAVRLSEELLGRKWITAFQAEAIREGRPERLIYGGRFICLDVLGEGGMGRVYKASQPSMKRLTAIKTISSAHAKSQEMRQRFQRELEAAGRLKHRNIITVYDGGVQGDESYLAMEYIEGRTLLAIVNQEGPRPWRQACEWVAQMADGLAYIHEMKIIHRDIKPDNVMRTDRGEIKILDLGLARFTDGDDGLTQTASRMGTIEYMAPEQTTDAKRADERADIYSLGCVLYFLCVGKTVFAHCNGPFAKMYAHGFEAPPKLCDGCPDGPEELETIFQKAVMKQARDRQRAMIEIADGLRGLLAKPSSSANRQAQPASALVVEAPPTRVEMLTPQPPVVSASSYEGSKAGQERSDNGLGMKLVWCPPGTFLMGGQRVNVRLTRGFWIGKYEVTQEEWRKVMGTTIRDQAKKGTLGKNLYGEGPKHPMYYVSYHDAMEFCRKLTEQERGAGRLPMGWRYTLPTEAQWEYAGRAGATTEYAFGDRLDKGQANFGGNVGSTTEVGSYAGNAWGLCDVHGNVWEWCLDDWSVELRGGDDPFVGKADGFSNGSHRVLRGGCWDLTAGFCGFSYRRWGVPSARCDDLGFRLLSVP